MFQAWDNRALAIWYTFDPDGNPAWLLAVDPVFEDGDSLVFDVLRPVGAVFGDAFDRDAVDVAAWGELRLEFDGCLAAELSWTTDAPAGPMAASTCSASAFPPA